MEVKLQQSDKLKWRGYQDLAGCPCPWHYFSLKWILLASVSPWLSSSPRLCSLHKSILHLCALVLHPFSFFSASGQCLWFSQPSLCRFFPFTILCSSPSLSSWDAPLLPCPTVIYQQHHGFGCFLRPSRDSLWLLVSSHNSVFCHFMVSSVLSSHTGCPSPSAHAPPSMSCPSQPFPFEPFRLRFFYIPEKHQLEDTLLLQGPLVAGITCTITPRFSLWSSLKASPGWPQAQLCSPVPCFEIPAHPSGNFFPHMISLPVAAPEAWD